MRNSKTMIKTIRPLGLAAVVAFAAAGMAWAEGNALQTANANIHDVASLQRGARLYFNYCSGCHSIKYESYSRLAADLQLPPDEVLKNFAFASGDKIGDQIVSSMSADQGTAFFGKAPPDLSLEARAKGPDWIYSYLKSFYVDPSRPQGWNNTVFPGASMPNVLWELQGVQHAQYAPAKPGEDAVVEKLLAPVGGKLDAGEFDHAVRDVTAFLQYVGEPAALKRTSVGVWAIVYLIVFTILAWFLKREYWKDVH